METRGTFPEQVVLVNEQDEEVGTMEKLEAHRSSVLHRAFSIFIFDKEGRLLIQRRALDKYHSAGLWTNTCCSHPRPGERLMDAANRRLAEEMGLTAKLEERFVFTYKASFPNGLFEHELDHVLFGRSDATPIADPSEVADWRYVTLTELEQAMAEHPENHTAWLHLAIPLVIKELEPNCA